MFCDSCSKLAFFPKHHSCVNCARFTSYREEKWCNYCATLKNICGICGKTIKPNDKVSQELTEQIKKTNPSFYGSGCRSCGGGRKH